MYTYDVSTCKSLVLNDPRDHIWLVTPKPEQKLVHNYSTGITVQYILLNTVLNERSTSTHTHERSLEK